MAVQAGNRMQMLGMILVTGEEPIIESEFTVWKGHSIVEENWKESELVPMITRSAYACSQELEHFHNHQGFINNRVKGADNTTYYHDE